MMMMMYSKLTL